MVSPYQPHRFPESDRNTTDAGPDFPGSSGDRERGKFRPSQWPRLDVVAVSDDQGMPLLATTDQLLRELLLWQKATVLALMYFSQGTSFSISDILAEASHI